MCNYRGRLCIVGFNLEATAWTNAGLGGELHIGRVPLPAGATAKDMGERCKHPQLKLTHLNRMTIKKSLCYMYVRSSMQISRLSACNSQGKVLHSQGWIVIHNPRVETLKSLLGILMIVSTVNHIGIMDQNPMLGIVIALFIVLDIHVRTYINMYIY